MRTITPAILLAAVLPAVAQDMPAGAQLYIATTPAAATVVWDGSTKGPTPLTLTGLKPGKHLLSVKKEGYRAIHRTVAVEEGKKAALQLDMARLTGLVLIHTKPEGAIIDIDGADRGKAPVLVTDLPLGRYRIRASLAGYVAKEVDLTVDNRIPVKVDIELPSSSAALRLTSRPEGAHVTVNGIAKGQTPITVERIPEGNVVLELWLEGCESYKQTIKLAAGETQDIEAVLKPVPALLKVVSIPPGARIYVDNQYRGESPVTVRELEPGEHRIRAELPAHKPMARTVTLTRAQELIEEFRLESNSGIFELITEPAGVKVFVDGKELGTTNAKKDETDRVSLPLKIALLTIGDHKVHLIKEGYYDKEFSIIIEKMKTVTRHEKLERRFIPDYEVITPSRVYRGVLKSIDAEGTIRLEIRPGVIKAISADKVRARRPIRKTPAEKEKDAP